MYVYGCPLHIILTLEIAPVSSKEKAPHRYSIFSSGVMLQLPAFHGLKRFSTTLVTCPVNKAGTCMGTLDPYL